MNRTKIEWTDYTWNPIKGLCPMNCSYCYAKKIYRRFNLNPKIRLDIPELSAPIKVKKPSRIFVGSTIEMYHPQIPHEWVGAIIASSWDASQHTYITLTKRPWNLESIEFPEWWWIGITITYSERGDIPMKRLVDLRDNLKFISFEPLFGDAAKFVDFESFNWVIIGAQTNPLKLPEKSWVENIVRSCNKYRIPVFLKNNLKPLIGDNLRQEFPKL